MIKVKNKLRVQHYPQIPCEPFIVNVKDEEEAYKVSKILGDQHCFLFDNGIIDDYSNVITVTMWEEDTDGEGNEGWVDYYNEEEMMEFDEFSEKYLQNID